MVFVSSEEVFLSFKYLKFCLDFLIMEKNDLIRKIMLISKFFGDTSCKKDCTNILRNKDNHLLFYYYLIFIFFYFATFPFRCFTIITPNCFELFKFSFFLRVVIMACFLLLWYFVANLG